MKYAIWGLLAAAAIVLSFQNCKKNVVSDEVNSISNVTKINLVDENPTSVVFYFEEVQTLPHGSGSYQVKGRSQLSVDLATGVVTKTTDPASQTNVYCLTEALKSELSALLAASQVCRFQRVPPAGTMCTMALLEAYADIITSRETFAVGSASDGCRSSSVELCDDTQTNVFQNYAEKLKNSYQQLSCPN